MKLKRLMVLVMSIALAIAPNQSIRLAAQVAEPVVTSPGVGRATELAISGSLLRSDRKTPVADECLRLRRMDTNAIVARTVSDKAGAFSFSVSEPGIYLVEVVDCDDDDVKAVSDALGLASAPLTIAVVLPTTLVASLLSSTAFLVLSAASAAGITALAIGNDQGGDPPVVLSPEQ